MFVGFDFGSKGPGGPQLTRLETAERPRLFPGTSPSRDGAWNETAGRGDRGIQLPVRRPARRGPGPPGRPTMKKDIVFSTHLPDTESSTNDWTSNKDRAVRLVAAGSILPRMPHRTHPRGRTRSPHEGARNLRHREEAETRIGACLLNRWVSPQRSCRP